MQQFGVSTVVYNPLAGGLLTGKHRQSQVMPGTRFDNNQLYQDRYWHAQYFQAVERLKAIAQSAGRSMVSLSLNWLLHGTPPPIARRPKAVQARLLAVFRHVQDWPAPPGR